MAIETFTKENVNLHAEQNRKNAYEKTTDPMFMQVQRGEITQEEWVVEINKIKQQFPYVDADIEMEVGEPAVIAAYNESLEEGI